MIGKSLAILTLAAFAAAPVAFAAPGDTPGAPSSTTAPAAAATSKPGAVKAKKPATAKQLAQRQKMKSCSADAKTKGLKGADRKSYMKTCLKG